jgi:hypothetical protein
MTGCDKCFRTGGNQRNAILVRLDFLWNADLHEMVVS